MASSTTTIAFAGLGVGTLLVISGIRGHTVGDVLNGKVTDTPIDPGGGRPDPSPTGVASTDTPSTDGLLTTGKAHLGAIESEANRIDRLHRPYRWGGGHAGYTDMGPWDCSGAVSQVLHRAELWGGPPLISSALMAWGEKGEGKIVTVYANPTHTFMKINGRYWGTSASNFGGGAGWIDHPMPTDKYVARHPKGL